MTDFDSLTATSTQAHQQVVSYTADSDIPPVWKRIIGQIPVVNMLSRVATSPQSITQSWLICGPAGSGRSQVARAFAAALNCPQGGCGQCESCMHIAANTHPDVTVLATERVTISIDDVRSLIETAQQTPSVSAWRIMIIEDVDRMTERTTNVLLKDIEEPSARTLWILCAPSSHDVLPTIRSRTRIVNLAIPDNAAVAQFLMESTGIDEAHARQCARYAQGHIGIGRYYATHRDALEARGRIIEMVTSLSRASQAVVGVGSIVSTAQEQARSSVEESVERAQQDFRRLHGLSDKDAIPSQIRSAYNALSKKEDVDRKVTRLTRDVVDRELTTISSIFRDVLVVHNDAELVSGLINREYSREILEFAERITTRQALDAVDRIHVASRRIAGNTPIVLALEALMTSLIF